MVANDDSKSKDKSKTNDDIDREPVVDFNALPSEVVQSYISFYDLAQSYPPLDSSQQDGGSSSNGRKRKGRAASPLTTTSSRKRNAAENSAFETAAALSANAAKTGEDEIACPPHFFDADAATNYLSQVATQHFALQPAPKEGEVVVGFLYKCRAKGELNRPLAHYRLTDTATDKAQAAEPFAQRSR
ncbi:uncharacterized protein SRS1_13506 [Sporisorium reilianum f. sp. reilianum]|uniref:Uncharacterized protein n=1 Tax=Sporisorium reilianum f. sp. reilianum TaxID=72559 RepID=A0A2N8UMD6_9BASI|nr:uncharacterized protein SRS1_13506 [Sporisorium reilianum f. sp. reilianum]